MPSLAATKSPPDGGPQIVHGIAVGLALIVFATLIRTSLLSEGLDLEIFWKTGRRILRLQPIYVPEVDGGRCFKYPPWAAPLFAPLGLLSESAAGVMWRLLLTGCLGWSTAKLLSGRNRKAQTAIFGCFVAMIGIWNHNIMSGQLTTALVAAALLPFMADRENEGWRMPAMIIGLSTKIFPLMAVLAFGRRLGRPRLWGAVLLSAATLSIPALLATPGHSILELFHDFAASASNSGGVLAGAPNGLPALLGSLLGIAPDEIHRQGWLVLASLAIVLPAWNFMQRRLPTDLHRAALALALSITVSPLAFTYGLGLAYPWFALRLADAAERRFQSPHDWIAVAGLAWLILPLPYRALAPFLSVASVAAINLGSEKG